MAQALNGGHINRAIDFYNTPGKYFIIGGTTPWSRGENTPDDIKDGEFKLLDVVGLQKVAVEQFVVPITEDEIANYDIDEGFILTYRNTKWKKISDISKTTTITGTGVDAESTVIPVQSVEGFKRGDKVRVADTYEGTIESMVAGTNPAITLNTPAPSRINSGAKVVGGVMAEGAKYVYLECSLYSNAFPLKTPSGSTLAYRQVGLCTAVTPDTSNTLLSASYSESGSDEYTSLGVLEILDNRAPTYRDIDTSEELSLIVQF